MINGVQSDVISMLYVDPAFDNPAVALQNPRHCTMANDGRSCVFAPTSAPCRIRFAPATC